MLTSPHATQIRDTALAVNGEALHLSIVPHD